VQANVHAGPEPPWAQSAVPFAVGGAQTLLQVPQWLMSIGSTQSDPQSSDVPESLSHPTAQVALEHMATPSPASGPAHTFVHDPQ
jgi:hypothetical protein